jgi:hypothetical protein
MFHVEHYLPKCINSTEMSLGETPLMRPACEIEVGRILDNFCLASIERELILLKSKFSGIFKFSSLVTCLPCFVPY